MKRPEGARVPTGIGAEVSPAIEVVSPPESDVATMKSLGANAGPLIDSGEVEQTQQRPTRRRQIATGPSVRVVELVAVERGRTDSEDVGMHPPLQVVAEVTQAARVVELVPVDRQDPGLRPGQIFDERMRLGRV